MVLGFVLGISSYSCSGVGRCLSSARDPGEVLSVRVDLGMYSMQPTQCGSPTSSAGCHLIYPQLHRFLLRDYGPSHSSLATGVAVDATTSAAWSLSFSVGLTHGAEPAGVIWFCDAADLEKISPSTYTCPELCSRWYRVRWTSGLIDL